MAKGKQRLSEEKGELYLLCLLPHVFTHLLAKCHDNLQLRLSLTHKAVFIFILSRKRSRQLTSGMFALDKAMGSTLSVTFAYILLHETNP
jgi:hypothetical protein